MPKEAILDIVEVSTVITDAMNEYLQKLEFSEKEIKVYLALIELGMQASSTIARSTELSKSTVLFLLDGLSKRGIVQKSHKGNVQYYFADPKDLLIAEQALLKEKTEALEHVIPLLSELKSPFSAIPKVTFFEGIEGCRKIYWQLLEAKTEILEFGVHSDLVQKFGETFMNEFIAERVKRGLFLKALAQEDPIEEVLQKLDIQQCREIRLFSGEFGRLYSSIAIFEEKVLLLNLFRDAFGILIENPEFSKTMRTIFEVQWEFAKKELN